MEANEKKRSSVVTYDAHVEAAGAKFPGSFAPAQRVHEAESTLPLPRGKLTVKTVLRPLTVGWKDGSIWAAAFVEAVATLSLCFTSGLLGVTFTSFDTRFIGSWVGLLNVVLLTLFIYATAPASGGHLNPMITLATMLTGLTGFSRAILYMVFQTAGAAAAGGLFRAAFGDAAGTKYNGGGCFFDHGVFPPGRAFLLETVFSFILLFLAFGVALDPRQAQLSGPMLGPFFVALALGLMSFAASGISPEYAGPGMNPARCLAFGIARNNYEYQWIWWFGPLAGALLGAAMYRAVPPWYAAGEKLDPTSSHLT